MKRVALFLVLLGASAVAVAGNPAGGDNDNAELTALRQEVRLLANRVAVLENLLVKSGVPAPQKSRWRTQEMSRLLSDGLPLPADWKPSVGEPVRIQQSGVWWRGQVLEVSPKGEIRVHYVGWSDTWDEVVTRERLQLPSPADLVAAADDPAKPGHVLTGPITITFSNPVKAPPIINNPGPIEPTGQVVTADTPLKPGMKVEVLWYDSWWAGQVRKVVGPDRVGIHYTGWSDTFDKIVPLDHLRVNAPPK